MKVLSRDKHSKIKLAPAVILPIIAAAIFSAMKFNYVRAEVGGNNIANNAGSGVITLIFFLIAWSLVWKGMALWRAARNKSKIWFVILFVVNTLGILDILYIFIFSKNRAQQEFLDETSNPGGTVKT